MSRPHIRGPGYTGSGSAPGYETPYASNYDHENQFFTGGIWDALGPHDPFSTPFGINVPSLLKHGGVSDHSDHHGGHSRRDRDDDDKGFPWTTFAWASLAVVGAGVIVYAATKRGGK